MKMSLPNYEEAYIDKRTLTEDLLSRDHPDATAKSAFFYDRYGNEWIQLRDDLLAHATGPVASIKETRHGTTVIEGPLSGALVRSVWMIRTGDSVPRLGMAYPIE
jgi:hypothetical protein